MGVQKFTISFAWPALLLALVALGLALAGAAQYPLGAVVASSVRPSEHNSRPVPVIDRPQTKHHLANTARTHELPKLALSFDDGPNPLTTPLILRTLEEEHVRASFFVVGSRVQGNEAILQREYRDGDDIGNHSWSHPDFSTLSQAQIMSQITRTEQTIAAAGVPAPYMFRPPYGVLGKHSPAKVPLAIILWNIDPQDWGDHDAASLTKRIISEAKPGGIIDLHGIYIATAQAIKPAIIELKKHYQLVPVSQLLDIHPGQTGIYYGRR